MKPGDVVRIAYGKPMTVERLADDNRTAVCVWYEGEDLMMNAFAVDNLEPVPEADLAEHLANRGWESAP
jgi:uncharacterized protein YodC (DUF2158 family)